MPRMYRDLLILLGSVIVLWIGFSLFVKMPENPVMLSPEKEQKIGERYKQGIFQLPGFNPIHDPYIDSLLDITAKRFYEVQRKPRFDYTITLIDTDMPNAFALPGGQILVTKGLIGICDTQEELLAVIAHEIGHIEERHVVNRLIRELGIDLILSADPYVTGHAARILISSRYNRKQEEEADAFACELMLKAKLEPRALASLFRKFKDENALNHEPPEWISSHPNLDARIRSVLAFPVPEEFTPQKGWLDWDQLRNQLGMIVTE